MSALALQKGHLQCMRFDVVFMRIVVDHQRSMATTLLRQVLVTFAWIWREIFKFIGLAFPFF
jgi:hypothetical protein